MKTIRENFTPKNLWSSLIMGSLLVSLWMIAGFTVKYFIYLKQSNYSVAEVFEWGVIEVEVDKYFVCADFRFHTDGMDKYVSQHVFEDKLFSTKEAAEGAIQSMRLQEMKCYWFGSSTDPKVSMARNFPVKSLIYAMISSGVFFYFSALKKKFLTYQE